MQRSLQSLLVNRKEAGSLKITSKKQQERASKCAVLTMTNMLRALMEEVGNMQGQISNVSRKMETKKEVNRTIRNQKH